MTRKPWGSEQIIFEAGDARVKLLRVKPGKRLSLQYHETKREAMMLVCGAAILEHGTKRNEMEIGYIHEIEPHLNHRIIGFGNAECSILEMAYGSDEDIVRLADDFGRVKT